MTAFEKALGFTLLWEGGYVNRQSDPGGATNKGITQKTYDAWLKMCGHPPADVKNITDGEVHAIYKERYWTAGQCHEFPEKVAVVHFDACVNTGLRQAAKFLQRAGDVTADGLIGPATLAAASWADPMRMIDERRKFYGALVASKPSLGVFYNGWLRRLVDLEKYIKGMA